MQQEKEYESKHMIGLSDKARERYLKVHSQQSSLRHVITKHYRGKSYSNYLIRLPKKWSTGLDLHNGDTFEWTVRSYDPVILQLRKLEAGDSA